jgi:hypothetical protein
MGRAFAAIAALLLLGPLAHADEASQAQAVLEHCLRTADRQAIGVEELEKSCPGLWRAIDTLGYAQLISDDQYESLDRNGVADLIELREHFQAGAAQNNGGPDTAALAPILKQIAEPTIEKKQSKWDKFLEWLKKRLNRNSAPGGSWPDWLKNAHMSERAAKIAGWIVVGLVGLLALGIIVNELRVAGVFKRRRKSAAGETVAQDELPHNAREVLAETQLADQPTLLLRMLVAKLVEGGRLARERSLTHRELSQRARFDTADDRSAFEHVARLSEQAIYGERPLDSQTAEPVLTRGRALYDALLTQGAPAAS